MIFLAKPDARNGVKLRFPATGINPVTGSLLAKPNARNGVKLRFPATGINPVTGSLLAKPTQEMRLGSRIQGLNQ